MTSGDVVVSGAQLAAIIGCKPSYVVELKRKGRLVLADGGKGYLKAASLALYEETKDPSRAGVSARHAAGRGAPLAGAEPDDAEDMGDAADEPRAPGELPSTDAKRRAKALADRAETDAELARLELARELGELLPRSGVEQAVSEAATALRTALERIPDTLAPQLAATSDETKVRQLLMDEITHALEELSRGFRAAARGEEVHA
ncbi:DUF1441 family protein [Xanthomonas sp. XNM01]|uniref:DUF1441 family protein n=1 Tax=Xanthomonas sp. XNM01 TaxID=2769289 RepID=UPI001781DAEE|nr:DUF1441 family protein [Xanthomonas sp. XNM01]MBD9368842.1 DUF1441 family protein [Xanthomonas sp. XNM01]